ncbi:MAG: hypothetical protein ACI89J_003459 [Hyphomicrobiaceae bacterium]|jgi:hypothetical protein
MAPAPMTSRTILALQSASASASILLPVAEPHTAPLGCTDLGSHDGFMMRTILVAATGLLLAGCGDDSASKLVEKPTRPNPFLGYESQIRYAKDWYSLSHHQRAITVAHWSHDAGFTKSQSSDLIWCLKSMAEAANAKSKVFDEAKSECIDKVKASKPKG